MSELLKNYVAGAWVAGQGSGTPLVDPISGDELVRVSSVGLDLPAAFAYAREQGGGGLRAMGYAQRAERLAATAKLLQANRDAYYEIATANSGTVKNDSAVDIDGAIYTIGQYARWGAALGSENALLDGSRVGLAKDNAFVSQHVLVPTRGVALFINAFNFPSWGLWEKAAPALLSGVPVIAKPATATAWLTQRMVADVVAAGIWPEGALSLICGGSAGLLDALNSTDVLSFTGSAETAAIIRGHRAVTQRSVRVNIEADSLNSAILMPDAAPGSEAFDLLVKEVVREMTVKSGQKCTAIRRVFVQETAFDAALEAIAARLGKTTVGNPRNETVRMGALVNREQHASVLAGIEMLAQDARIVLDGRQATLIDADPAIAACVGPTLLASLDAAAAHRVHEHEVFGPVATVLAYRSVVDAGELVGRGGGSLVASLYGADAQSLADMALSLGDRHGRIHVISPEVAAVQSGHGNVMPQSLHGGPGRAGGGEELGGLRALGFYHRRAAIQAGPAVLDRLPTLSSHG